MSLDALYVNKAAGLKAQGRLAEACDAYLEAARLNPRNTQTLVDLGHTLAQIGRDTQAERAFADALAQAPERVDACIWRGNALYRLKRYDEALAMQDRALKLSPDFAPIHYNRGNALLRLRRGEEAVAAFDRALALEPDFVDALANKGAALQSARRYEEAVAVQDRVIALRPGLADAVANRGASLLELGRYDEAAASYLEAIRLGGGDHPVAELYLSYITLLYGDLPKGFRQMEARKRADERYGVGPYRNTEWLGAEDVAGKTVLVHAEQGLGDSLQMCRYLPMIAERGAHVIFAGYPSLKRLMSTVHPELECIDLHDERPGFDFHIPLMSLPLAFDSRIDTIPAITPYLSAEPDRVKHWRARLGEHGYRIGIAWKGSAAGAELGKAFPVALLRDIAALPGVRLVNLQTGLGWEELDNLPPGMTVERLGDDFDAGPDAFIDAAAVMENLDLVITTDTSLAHLAAALGRPTWVALKKVPDWRWLLDRQDTPWYPTMRLFRQAEIEDWSAVFPAMERELAAELERRGFS